MPHYLIQAAYTPEAWAAMTKNPHNRIEAIRPAIEALGGRLEAGYFCFGEYDVAMIVEMPDNVAAAGAAIGSASKGHLKALRTTPLLTPDEAVRAMETGGSADIPVPG
jgi:uncharacterized protein with GYD domain